MVRTYWFTSRWIGLFLNRFRHQEFHTRNFVVTVVVDPYTIFMFKNSGLSLDDLVVYTLTPGRKIKLFGRSTKTTCEFSHWVLGTNKNGDWCSTVGNRFQDTQQVTNAIHIRTDRWLDRSPSFITTLYPYTPSSLSTLSFFSLLSFLPLTSSEIETKLVSFIWCHSSTLLQSPRPTNSRLLSRVRPIFCYTSLQPLKHTSVKIDTKNRNIRDLWWVSVRGGVW